MAKKITHYYVIDWAPFPNSKRHRYHGSRVFRIFDESGDVVCVGKYINAGSRGDVTEWWATMVHCGVVKNPKNWDYMNGNINSEDSPRKNLPVELHHLRMWDYTNKQYNDIPLWGKKI
jgi:hypothetical protein